MSTTRTLRRIGAGAVVGTAVLALAPTNAFAATTASSTTPHSCTTGALPADVLGAPSLEAHSAQGVYLGHTSDYRLRVTHAGSKAQAFTVQVTTSAPMSVKKVRLEKADKVLLSKDRKTLDLTFINYGYIDGVDIDAHCSATVTVAARVQGQSLPSSQYFLGKHRAHPASTPVVITRTPATTSGS